MKTEKSSATKEGKLHMKTEQQVAEILLKSGAVILRPNEPFKFASGINSPIYCDNRLLLSKPSLREQIAETYAQKITSLNLKPDVIAGIATASIPWAALVASKLGLPMIYIRAKPKDHGRENLIEGTLLKSQKVVIIEDLISTGGSCLAAVKATRDAGGIVEHCIAILTYQMAEASDTFQREKCSLHALSNFNTLVKTASETGYIKKEDLKIALEWAKNPKEWNLKN